MTFLAAMISPIAKRTKSPGIVMVMSIGGFRVRSGIATNVYRLARGRRGASFVPSMFLWGGDCGRTKLSYTPAISREATVILVIGLGVT